jgi:hypothetical protein
MAAMQGTLAQLSAQAEDAKRAVLSKAGATSWFSNLNTVCTIKSAPPRTPEVLQMLATKSGWLYKRNEQHLWQARWCCVVPHTFLYYFDAPAGSTVLNGSHSGSSGSFPSTLPGAQQQEDWNHAVQHGLGDRKPHEKRSHFPLFHGSTPASALPASGIDDDLNNSNDNSAGGGIVPPNAQNLPPAGIIDLECYTTIHRSSENGAVLQLAGDDQVNPDLRAFYFCCDGTNAPGDVEEWSHAILNNRHSSLQDEVDAFKYVADSFAERLDLLYAELNEAKTQQEESEQVLYRVRSAAEGTCRTAYRTVDESWDRALPLPSSVVVDLDTLSLHDKRAEFRQNLEIVRQQDLGIPASIRVLADYVAVVEDIFVGLQHTVTELQYDVQKSDQTDKAEILELQAEAAEAAKRHMQEKEQILQDLALAQAEQQTAATELKVLQKELNSTKMEINVLLSQQRTKNMTLVQIKKKLKAEVLDLRQKLVDVVSDNSTVQHECDKLKLQLDQERKNNEMLKNYMSKVESQVQVQQNMMEMMSQAGGGSVYGGMSVNMNTLNGNRSVASHNEFGTNNYRIDRLSAVMNDVDDDDEFDNNDNDILNGHDAIDEDFENDERMLLQPPNIPISPAIYGRRRRMPPSQSASYRRAHSFMSDNDIDNKSHVSELTEDRTQREFNAFQNSQQHLRQHISTHQQQAYSPNGVYPSDGFQSAARERKRLQDKVMSTSARSAVTGPPSVIVRVKKNDIHSSTSDKSKHNLDTINNSTGSISTPPMHPNKGVTVSDSPTCKADTTSLTSADHSSTTESTAKVSIAQQSRIEADMKNTPVRVRLDEKSLSSLQRKASEANLKALANIGVIPKSSTTTPSRLDTIHHSNGQHSPQHSQGSGLWRRVEAAVLGPRSESDDDDDNDESSYDSEPSTRVTDMTDDANGIGDKAKRRFASRGDRDMDEKKSSDSVVSFSNLSLQERSLIQREKQIQFLREQGIIKSAKDVRGGAGAVDTASVTSSNAAMSTTTGSVVLKKIINPR